eukprot:TRINITY_DN230_c0_g1_i5.p1 TRINITY_DN230_c0_g1~~TRINITY_DN230_c0_g1_i5.p1  ORF type:complete len:538 (+),score=53.96 TRINITY_DN230_c0_g1_i5:336-1949(+)
MPAEEKRIALCNSSSMSRMNASQNSSHSLNQAQYHYHSTLRFIVSIFMVAFLGLVLWAYGTDTAPTESQQTNKLRSRLLASTSDASLPVRAAFSARTGEAASVVHLALPSGPGRSVCNIRWHQVVQGPCESMLTIGNHTVITSCGGVVSALSTGPSAAPEQRWQVKLALPLLTERFASAVLDPNKKTLFLDSGHGSILALTVKDGMRHWTHELESTGNRRSHVRSITLVEVSDMLQKRTLLIAGVTPASDSGAFSLSAIDCETGVLQWKYVLPTRAELVQASLHSAPVVASADGSVVYIIGGDGHLHAVDTTTGFIRWRYFTGVTAARSATTSRSPSELIFVAAWDGSVHALNESTGATVWKLMPFSNENGATIPVATLTVTPDSQWLVIGKGKRFVACNAATGAPLGWLHESPETPILAPIYAFAKGGQSPLLVYATADQSLRAVDILTGALHWRAGFPAIVASTPVASTEGLIFVAAGERLLSIDALTGQQFWSLHLQGPSAGPPTVSSGFVFMATSAELLALDGGSAFSKPCPK